MSDLEHSEIPRLIVAFLARATGVMVIAAASSVLCHKPLEWAWFAAMLVGWALVAHDYRKPDTVVRIQQEMIDGPEPLIKTEPELAPSRVRELPDIVSVQVAQAQVRRPEPESIWDNPPFQMSDEDFETHMSTPEEQDTKREDLESALSNLGYSKKQARDVAAQALCDSPGANLADLIRSSLAKAKV